MNQEIIWKIIDKYFKENPYSLVEHNLESYNNFFGKELPEIFIQNNPIKILKQQNEKTGEFNLTCHLYLGGKHGNKIYYGKPIIFDENISLFKKITADSLINGIELKAFSISSNSILYPILLI